MSKDTEPQEKPLAVSLPPRYWVTVLAILNDYLRTTGARAMEAERAKNRALDDIPSAERAVLVGPLMAQGAIIKAMHEAGEMSDEANQKLGLDSILEKAQQYNNRQS